VTEIADWFALIIGVLIVVGGLAWLLALLIRNILRNILIDRRYRRSNWCQISPRCILTRGHSGPCDWV
jgi:hypothetical protein